MEKYIYNGAFLHSCTLGLCQYGWFWCWYPSARFFFLYLHLYLHLYFVFVFVGNGDEGGLIKCRVFRDPDNTSGGQSWSVRYTQVGHRMFFLFSWIFSGYLIILCKVYKTFFTLLLVRLTQVGHSVFFNLSNFTGCFLHYFDFPGQ